MDYKAIYAEKLTTAEKLAECLQSGWVIGTDAAPGQPDAILGAFADKVRNSDIKDVKVHTMLDAIPMDFYADNSLFGKMTGMSWFSSGGARKAVNGGFADLFPAYYRDIPGHMRTNYDYDAFCIQVSPMDSHGYFSLGCIGSYSEAMIDKAKHIFIEVNEKQPRALTALQLHVSQVDAIVENTHDLPTLPSPVLDETSITIGNIIAEQICDGACIQLGIGAIPDATGMALKAKHDLGIHTEMFTSSMVDLLECGAGNNSKKQIHRGKTVTTFAYGSKRIYDFIDQLLRDDFAGLPVERILGEEFRLERPVFVELRECLHKVALYRCAAHRWIVALCEESVESMTEFVEHGLHLIDV